MRILLALLVLFAITSCVSTPRPAQRAPRVAPPRVVALPVPAPQSNEWRDWPQTPGDWRYTGGESGSYAEFGAPDAGLFAIGCDRATRQVSLSRLVGADTAHAPTMLVRTSSVTRTLTVTETVDGTPPVAVRSARLANVDPLLDAIAFSRGRFVVEQPGQPRLVLPAWAEIDRVIEDCRG